MILSGSATAAGISHASLTLKTVGMADLLDGVKSDANRTFDYLNGALVGRTYHYCTMILPTMIGRCSVQL